MTQPSKPTSCEGCGVCCLVVTTPPFRRVFDGEGEEAWERLRRERPDLVRQIQAAERARRAEGLPISGSACVWFDTTTRLCRHHELRPRACREFDLAGTDCLDARRRAGIADGPTQTGRPDTPALPVGDCDDQRGEVTS